MKSKRHNVWGTILPGGNSNQFPMMRKLLKERKIKWAEVRMKQGGIIFLVAPEDVPKLPVWKGNRFFPTDRDPNGHSGWEVNARMIYAMLLPLEKEEA